MRGVSDEFGREDPVLNQVAVSLVVVQTRFILARYRFVFVCTLVSVGAFVPVCASVFTCVSVFICAFVFVWESMFGCATVFVSALEVWAPAHGG